MRKSPDEVPLRAVAVPAEACMNIDLGDRLNRANDISKRCVARMPDPFEPTESLEYLRLCRRNAARAAKRARRWSCR